MCRLCKAAYQFDPEIFDTKAFADLGFTNIRLIENKRTCTQAFILKNPDMTVVVFPGSKELKDWLTNFKFWKQRIRTGKMHKGFYQASKSVNATISEAIATNELVYVTGHSLGGALASIFASKHSEVLACYTFGAPRIYNRKAAKAFDNANPGNHFRCVVAGDVVPRWPKPVMNYRHVAKRVYFGLDGRIQQSTNRSRWFDTVADLVQEFRDGTLLQAEDHMLELQEEYLIKEIGRAAIEPERINVEGKSCSICNAKAVTFRHKDGELEDPYCPDCEFDLVCRWCGKESVPVINGISESECINCNSKNEIDWEDIEGSLCPVVDRYSR